MSAPPPPGDMFLCGTSVARELIEGALGADVAPGETRALKLATPRGTERLDVNQVALGDAHGAVLTRGGDVYTWGAGAAGALGRGTGHGTSYPELVDALIPQRTTQVMIISSGVGDVVSIYTTGEVLGHKQCFLSTTFG